MEIKWTDADPETGERRWVRAERFARKWDFTYRTHRRGASGAGPTADSGDVGTRPRHAGTPLPPSSRRHG